MCLQSPPVSSAFERKSGDGKWLVRQKTMRRTDDRVDGGEINVFETYRYGIPQQIDIARNDARRLNSPLDGHKPRCRRSDRLQRSRILKR